MLKSILSTATFRQSQITILGTLINGGLGAVFYILLARYLGPADFGLITIALTTMVLFSDIADIGTNTGLIRFVSSNLGQNRDKAYRFLKLSLEIKLFAWAISFLIIFFLAPFLATQLFHKAELILPLRLTAFGVGGALLFTFVTSALQAYQKYFLWSIINIFTNSLRLILLIILGYYLLLNVESSLIVYIILPFFGFFISLFILPARKILISKNEFSLSGELFKYNIPVAIFTVIAAFSARLDTYLNAILLSARDVGIYGAANNLVQIMPQLISALGLVAAPKFASFQNNTQMLTYFKKFQLFVLGLCLLGILTIPLSTYLIPILFGGQYQEAALPFIFLFLAMLIFLFSIPVHHSVIFYFGRPDVFIWVSIGHLLIIGGVGYFMIQNFGVLGASITVLVGTIFNFLYPLIWLLIKLKK
ncbi:MAG: oligosaccharide flippase family protein [Candidatus Daviesbacteria bacterium]|nr:oligosaccharide flippase family protein [Candidatus Daviesbacteria bacterium]